MNEISYQIIKWTFIVFVAGFIGQFGKSLTLWILKKLRKKKELNLQQELKKIEKKKDNKSKLEKKRIKAELKRLKKLNKK